MTEIACAVMYGMGGALAETWPTGERQLVQMLKGIGVDTGNSPYQDFDRQSIYDFLRHRFGKIAIVGDSLGACNAPLYAGDMTPRKVDFIGGFQPSIYGQGVDPVSHEINVPANVIAGLCIWDPVFTDTGGLGAAHWKERPGVTVIARRGSHPDDWGTSQALMFAAFKQAMGLS